jgi:hypothetical protein
LLAARTTEELVLVSAEGVVGVAADPPHRAAITAAAAIIVHPVRVIQVSFLIAWIRPPAC